VEGDRLLPTLQVALDLIDLFKAVKLASQIAVETKCENIWIEAGTPLIKKWGTLAVEALKKTTGCFVVADTKTMDTGALEAKMMFDAGADAVTVLSLADDKTIRDAAEEAHARGRLLIMDLINNPNPIKRAIEAYGLGVDIVLYHMGIDVQLKRNMSVAAMIDEIKMIREKAGGKIAVAGGIKHQDVPRLLDAGVEIIVVGGAITRAPDPLASTLRFLEEIKSRGS
jgi:3-hexulose-6-phosphate synthase